VHIGKEVHPAGVKNPLLIEYSIILSQQMHVPNSNILETAAAGNLLAAQGMLS